MKKTITIELTLDTETAYVEELAITQGMYARTEIISEFDEPASVHEVVRCIEEELTDML